MWQDSQEQESALCAINGFAVVSSAFKANCDNAFIEDYPSINSMTHCLPEFRVSSQDKVLWGAGTWLPPPSNPFCRQARDYSICSRVPGGLITGPRPPALVPTTISRNVAPCPAPPGALRRRPPAQHGRPPGGQPLHAPAGQHARHAVQRRRGRPYRQGRQRQPGDQRPHPNVHLRLCQPRHGRNAAGCAGAQHDGGGAAGRVHLEHRPQRRLLPRGRRAQAVGLHAGRQARRGRHGAQLRRRPDR